MIRKIITFCLTISLFSALFLSCFTPDDIRLTEQEKEKYIDSVYQQEYKRLQPTMDKGCEENFEKLMNRAVDSLVNVYLDSTKYDY